MPCCNQCGNDNLEVIFRDRYDGTLYQCQTCSAKLDQTEVIEDGKEAEALRERNEEAIGDRQYAVWLERKEREIAILKAAAPGMCGIDDNDLECLKVVLNG